jgi:hypothetical protein
MSGLASGRPRPASCGERAGVNPRLRGKPATPRLVAPIRHLHLNRNPNLNRILNPNLNLHLTRSHTIDRLNQPSETGQMAVNYPKMAVHPCQTQRRKSIRDEALSNF